MYGTSAWRLVVGLAAAAVLAGCASAPPTVTLARQSGWHEGKQVYYITTDISEAGMANMMNANFAPRLADAVTAVPKPPGEKSVLERVYKFTADAQDAVFASVPNPIGPTSRDTIYSPLWLVFWVTWKPGVEPQLLTSEEAILAAEEAGKVELKRTDIVINCPIVGSPAGAMPGVVISR